MGERRKVGMMERVVVFGENAVDPREREIHIEQGDDVIIVDRAAYGEMMAQLGIEGERLGWVAE